MWFIMLLSQWRIILSIALAAGTFAYGYRTGAKGVQQDWDGERQQQVAAHEQNQKTIKELQEAKNANLATIDDLRRKLAGNRVRVPTTRCPEAAAAGGSETQTSGAGELPTTVQSAFDDFTLGVGELMYEADTLTESCRVLRDWAASLEKK